MGTTSPKGLRYPEPTALARTLHTQIRNLADDANSALVAQDVRFQGLDTKTTTTNNDLATRGNILARYGASAGVFTHSPNDGVNRTINQHTDLFYVPATARTAIVSLSMFSQGFNSCACVWEPLISFTTGGTNWMHVNGNSLRSHTQGNGILDMGYYITSVWNVMPYRGNYGSVANNCANDATSASWLSHGHLFWNVTLFS